MVLFPTVLAQLHGSMPAQILTAYAGQLQLTLHILLVCSCMLAFNKKITQSTPAFKKKKNCVEALFKCLYKNTNSAYFVSQNRKKEIGNGISMEQYIMFVKIERRYIMFLSQNTIQSRMLVKVELRISRWGRCL